MRLRKYLIGLLIAAALLAFPAREVADRVTSGRDTRYSAAKQNPAPPPNDVGPQSRPMQPFELASVDFCYIGSVVDPATGELVHLYDECTNDAIGGNYDLA